MNLEFANCTLVQDDAAHDEAYKDDEPAISRRSTAGRKKQRIRSETGNATVRYCPYDREPTDATTLVVIVPSTTVLAGEYRK
jgi:hypothetical protein